MKKHLYIFFILSLATACSPQSNTSTGLALHSSTRPSIVGGETVTNESFAKHIVGIYNVKKGYWCTASLIGPSTLLTAAHCFMGNSADHVVYFARDVFKGSPQTAKIKSYKPHPESKPLAWTDRNDLAVARFEGVYPQGYQPIRLPDSTDLQQMNGTFHTTGYGAITARRGSSQRGVGVLRYTTMKMKESPLRPEQNQFIADQSNGHGVCFGDSGGPAFVKNGDQTVIIGVISAVYSTDENARTRADYDVCRYSSIYISIYPYKNWIRKAVADL